MKHRKLYIVAGVAALISVTSCKKVDLFPTTSIEASQSFKAVKDAASWDIGIYSAFRGRQYGTYHYYSDVQADQLNASLDFGNRNGAPHRWDMTADDQTIGPQWQAYYSALVNVNEAIAGYPSIPTTSTSDINVMNQYTGDAYLARAFYYHRLILRWAKPYEAATAATDLGVPLVLTFDLNGKPARATVQAVYNQIIADINKAKTLLVNVTGTPGSAVFTIDAALALEARVRLDMKDYAGAYAAANTLIAGNKYPLITTQAGLTAYWATDGNSESIMQMAVSTTELPNTDAIYLGLISATGKFDPDFIPTKDIINLYPAGDLRSAAYFASKSCTIAAASYTLTLVNKYPGNAALNPTQYAQAPKVFRIGEMYCIAAEASAALATPAGEANALTAINALRIARGELALTALTGTALRDAIRDERTRELAFEGFRLNDLKRWHLGFTRGTPQNLNPIYNGTTYNLLTIAADANKFTWAIPSNDISTNPNEVQNPGW